MSMVARDIDRLRTRLNMSHDDVGQVRFFHVLNLLRQFDNALRGSD